MKIQFGEREFEVDVKIVISVAIALVCVVAYLFVGKNNLDGAKGVQTEVTVIGARTIPPSELGVNERSEDGEIRVYVKGCVKKPGVYSLKSGSLIIDAVNAAGGFTRQASQDFNLVWELKGNCVINIPKMGEAFGNICSSSLVNGGEKAKTKRQGDKKRRSRNNKEPKDTSGLININKASKEELMKLNGVGDVIADRIIDYRKTTKFNRVEDLKNVSGIGEKTFENMKDFICTK